MERSRRGLGVGFALVVVLAASVAIFPDGPPRPRVLLVDVVMVPSAPDARVPRPAPGSFTFPPVCDVTPSTGRATVSYRIGGTGRWEDLDFALCRPPGYSPGGTGFLFRSPQGIDLGVKVPVTGWIPNQRWRGADAQIGFTLPDGRVWLAWDRAMPCRIRTAHLRHFRAPIVSFHDEPTEGGALVGASARASLECRRLPRFEGTGPPVDLRGELTVSNCEGVRSVVPPPRLRAGCENAGS